MRVPDLMIRLSEILNNIVACLFAFQNLFPEAAFTGGYSDITRINNFNLSVIKCLGVFSFFFFLLF